MNISGHRERHEKEMSNTQMNICAGAFIVFLIGVLGLFDWFDRGDAVKFAARHEAVRAAMDARTFCKAPVNREVLHMRADVSQPGGYACVTYDNVGYGRAPYEVAKK